MGDFAGGSFTGGLLELLPAALFADAGLAIEGFAALFAADFAGATLAALFAVLLAVLFAVLFTAPLEVLLGAPLAELVFASCDFFADLAGADLDFSGLAGFAAGFVDFAAGLAAAFAASLAAAFDAGLDAGIFAAAGFDAGAFALTGWGAGAGAGAGFSLPPTSARTSPFRLNPDFAGAVFDLSVVFFELTAIPFFRPPWIVLVRPNR